MKTEYVYKNPVDNGYKRFKLTKRQHNQLFKNRQLRWIDRYEYYYNDKGVILHKFYNPLVVGLNTLIFPINVLIFGIVNFKECWRDLKSLYQQKKYGSFVSDHIWCSSKKYNEIMEVIKNQK